jgi:lipopolysaccharide transport system permease protein
MLLFWLSPIIYDVATVPDSLRSVIYLNPQAFILSYQDILYRHSVPEMSRILILIVLTMISLLIGYAVNHSYKARFAEEV